MIRYYLDHRGTVHRGPDPCPNASAMGAGLTDRQFLGHVRGNWPTCPTCVADEESQPVGNVVLNRQERG